MKRRFDAHANVGLIVAIDDHGLADLIEDSGWESAVELLGYEWGRTPQIARDGTVDPVWSVFTMHRGRMLSSTADRIESAIVALTARVLAAEEGAEVDPPCDC